MAEKNAKTAPKKKTVSKKKDNAVKKEVKRESTSQKVSRDRNSENKEDLIMWKTIAITLGIVFVVLSLFLLGIYVNKNMEISMKDSDSEEKSDSNSNTNAANTNSAPQAAEIKAVEDVSLIVIEDPNCSFCDVDSFVLNIQSQGFFSNLEVEKISLDDPRAIEFIANTDAIFAPLYLFSDDITSSGQWAQIGGAFVEETFDGESVYRLRSNPTNYALKGDVPVTDSAVVLGNPNAKITVYEFSDYECPYCAIAEGDTALAAAAGMTSDYEAPIPKLLEEYVDTGKVRYVFYNFPLESIHPRARVAHHAALCAHEQDAWREYNKELFTNRNRWIEADDMQEELIVIATEFNLDKAAFETCMDSNKFDSQIDEEIELGLAHGVGGTPGFYIGKYFLSGAQDFSTFKEIIDSELSS